MARGVKVKLDRAGIQDILKSDAVGDLCEELGQDIADAAEDIAGNGAEFDVRRFVGRDRVRVHVGTANWAAMHAEAKYRALTRAIGGVW